MRILAIILSVYIVYLISLPCIDEPHDHHAQENVISQKTTEVPQNGEDHCSPFCNCQCCVTPVVFQNLTVHFECFSFIQKEYSEYFFSTISSPSVSIWQPPKIG